MANINGTPGADILNGTGGGVIDTHQWRLRQ